jgi:hypothetical protein
MLDFHLHIVFNNAIWSQCYDMFSAMFSCHDLLMELLTLPKNICVTHIWMQARGYKAMISMNPQQFFLSLFSPLLCFVGQKNEKSEPEIPWAVIHTDVDGIACETFLLLFFRAGVGGWLLIAKLKKKPKAKNKARATNEIQRINKYNCFLSDGTHLNLFSGLMSWLLSKMTFCPFFS